MKTICGITPRELSEDEKTVYSDIMAAASPTICEAASRFDLSVRDFRREFFKGKLDTTAEETEAIRSVKGIENGVLEGYCRLVPKLARKFFVVESKIKRAVVFDDYLQEGVCAISDAMFQYQVGQKFSTYAICAIKNRLVDYIRKDNSLSPIKKRTIKLRMKIQRQMNKTGKTFDEIVDEMKISQNDRDECLASMAKTVNDPEVRWDHPFTMQEFAPISGLQDRILEALEQAPLSDFERDILHAHMHGEVLSSVTSIHHRSRMAGTYALRRALATVKQMLKGYIPEYAETP